MTKPLVDIAIACGPYQVPNWWTPFAAMVLDEERHGEIRVGGIQAIQSAMPDHNKNHTQGGPLSWQEDERAMLTDANRVTAAQGFLGGKADWVFWLDDDTIPPQGTITQLVRIARDAVGGLYYSPRNPVAPIAYLRADEGYYYPLTDWAHGALMQVDSIGLGCTLIHRSVFEKIMREFTVFQRHDRTLYPVHKSRIFPPTGAKKENKPDLYVQDGWFHMRSSPVEADNDRPWPFFAMEYGRTEDHYFWELAEQVGVKPWVDTSINCGHAKIKVWGREDYKESKLKEEAGELHPTGV